MNVKMNLSADAPPPVLLVDDEPQFLLSSGVTLRAAGIAPVQALEDSRQVIPFLAAKGAAVVVLDLTMPHVSGIELLKMIRDGFPGIPVIVMTGLNEVDTAVSCMRDGAFDYLVKPVESSRFVSSVHRALEMRALQDEVSSLKTSLLSSRLERESPFSKILTRSMKMNAIFRYIEAVAKPGQAVFITGETGVGKELVARAVHDSSGFAGGYVAVNVAGLDDAMFSDTLFGHRKGAYTGADQAREGLIAKAAGGTLFLDEIGDMKESSQVKLLRLLEERKYYPLGADVPRQSEARIVCATDHDVQELMAAGRFRKDLYYRLSAHQIHIPPLRERLEDLPLLVDHFLEDAARSLQKKKPTPPPELLTLLSVYRFPGNIRELKTMVFNAVVQHRTGILSIESFRKYVGGGQLRPGPAAPRPAEETDTPLALSGRFPTLKETEDFLIAEALRRAGNNQGIAASLLGITRQALNKRLSRSGAAKDKS